MTVKRIKIWNETDLVCFCKETWENIAKSLFYMAETWWCVLTFYIYCVSNRTVIKCPTCRSQNLPIVQLNIHLDLFSFFNRTPFCKTLHLCYTAWRTHPELPSIGLNASCYQKKGLNRQLQQKKTKYNAVFSPLNSVLWFSKHTLQVKISFKPAHIWQTMKGLSNICFVLLSKNFHLFYLFELDQDCSALHIFHSIKHFHSFAVTNLPVNAFLVNMCDRARERCT